MLHRALTAGAVAFADAGSTPASYAAPLSRAHRTASARPSGRCGTGQRPSRDPTSCPSPRDNAQEHVLEVVIRYPHHPRVGQSVRVLGQRQEPGGDYLIVDQGNGTRALLPTWMTSQEVASFPLVEFPRFPIEAFRGLGLLVDNLSAALSEALCGDGPDARPPDPVQSRPEAGPDEQGRVTPAEAGRKGRGGAAARGPAAQVHTAKRSR